MAAASKRKKKISVYNVIWAHNPDDPSNPLCLVATKNKMAMWLHWGPNMGGIKGVNIVNNPGQPVFSGGSVEGLAGLEVARKELKEELGLVYDEAHKRLGDGTSPCNCVGVEVRSHQDSHGNTYQSCEWQLESREDLLSMVKNINANLETSRKLFANGGDPQIEDDEIREVRCMTMSEARASFEKSSVSNNWRMSLDWFVEIVREILRAQARRSDQQASTASKEEHSTSTSSSSASSDATDSLPSNPSKKMKR